MGKRTCPGFKNAAHVPLGKLRTWAAFLKNDPNRSKQEWVIHGDHDPSHCGGGGTRIDEHKQTCLIL